MSGLRLVVGWSRSRRMPPRTVLVAEEGSVCLRHFIQCKNKRKRPKSLPLLQYSTVRVCCTVQYSSPSYRLAGGRTDWCFLYVCTTPPSLHRTTTRISLKSRILSLSLSLPWHTTQFSYHIYTQFIRTHTTHHTYTRIQFNAMQFSSAARALFLHRLLRVEHDTGAGPGAGAALGSLRAIS